MNLGINNAFLCTSLSLTEVHCYAQGKKSLSSPTVLFTAPCLYGLFIANIPYL